MQVHAGIRSVHAGTRETPGKGHKLAMQVNWSGADVTALRLALRLTQPKFASRAGVSLSVVKKWAARGRTIRLDEFHGGLMNTMLDRATPEQRMQFMATQQAGSPTASNPPNPGATEDIAAEVNPGIWTSDCAAIAQDLTRKDLMLERRQAAAALVGVVVGVNLLEPLERLLTRATGEVPQMSPRGVGLQEITQLEATARAFREWDDQYGGGLRRKAVVGQLDEVSELLQGNDSPRIKQRLFGIHASLAETAATMSWDSGLQRTAQDYYMLAARSAKEADDPALCANAIVGMARQLLSLDHYGTAAQREDSARNRATDALELVRYAVDRFGSRVSPTVRAMLHTREAWAYGKLGRPSAFRRICDHAHETFADSDPDADPYWINYFDGAELSGTIGGRLLEMARRDPSFAEEAAQEIDRAITLRRPDRLRSSALDQLGIVEARMIQGEVEEACRLGNIALDTVVKTSSDRVGKKLLKVYIRTEQFVGVRGVAELRDRMQNLMPATV